MKYPMHQYVENSMAYEDFVNLRNCDIFAAII